MFIGMRYCCKVLRFFGSSFFIIQKRFSPLCEFCTWISNVGYHEKGSKITILYTVFIGIHWFEIVDASAIIWNSKLLLLKCMQGFFVLHFLYCKVCHNGAKPSILISRIWIIYLLFHKIFIIQKAFNLMETKKYLKNVSWNRKWGKIQIRNHKIF